MLCELIGLISNPFENAFIKSILSLFSLEDLQMAYNRTLETRKMTDDVVAVVL